MAVGASETELFSLSGKSRLEAIFARLKLCVVGSADEAHGYDDILVAHSGYVFDERVIADFLATRRSALIAERDRGGEAVVAAICRAPDARRWSEIVGSETDASAMPAGEGVTLYTASAISGSYNQRLRKKETPLVLKASPERKEFLERRLFKGSYKGATDIVTKFVLPKPAFHATRAAAALGIHPNLITTLSLIFVVATFYLFARGEFAAGLVCGWLMCFLDTVDGKLARVTLKSSKLGNLYDHGIDLIHPPFWYWAFAIGLVSTGNLSGMAAADVWTCMWVILVGYVVGRLIEGYFVRRFKIEIHIWRPIDYWFRHVTSRRNPNLLMLTLATIAGEPAIGFAAVALWTIASIAFHLARLIAAETEGRPLKSWLAE
jgi:phosphatidylglycerophosphate synthase